jgi:putative DNA primase/helicase
MSAAASGNFTAVRFLTAVARPRDAAIELRAISRGTVVGRRFCHTPDEITEFIDTYGQSDLYFGVAARRRDARDGSLASCAGLASLFVDLDFKHTPEPAALAALEAFELKPSALVASGGGLHAYWFLSQPLELADGKANQVKALLRKLGIKLGADLAAAEPARVLRIPSTRNFKYDPPPVVEIRAFDGHLHTLQQFDQALGHVADSTRPGDGSPTGGFELPDEIPDGTRHDTLFRFGRSLKAYGFSEAAILAALLIVNEKRCKPPGERSTIERIAHDAATLAGRPDFIGPNSAGANPGPDPEPGHLGEPPPPGEPPPGPDPELGPRPPAFSDDGLALRFTTTHARAARHVAEWGKWLFWDGCRWKPDVTLAAFNRARVICRAASTEAPPKFRRAITSAKTVAAVVNLARSDPRHATIAEQWDADPWLLNTPTGIVDLHTGCVAPHDPARYMSKVTAVGPAGGCPLWLKFLAKVTDDDEELQKYLARVCGYALTGSIREHALFFLYGAGNNGKGVFINTFSAILGDYATVAPMETFIASRGERHPTDLAGLRSARLVTAQETEQGRHWAEAKVKAITGGDPISARFMRQDFFTFLPIFKLLIAGNNKPQLRDVDEAIRRRFNLIPFEVVIPKAERDRNLFEKLRAEWPGILQWMIDGCLDWQRMELNPPEVVREATENYFNDEDALAQWIAACCKQGSPEFTFDFSTALYNSWKDWAKNVGEEPGTQKAFVGALEKRGFPAKREGGTGLSIIRGLNLLPNPFRTPDEERF